MSKYYDGLGLFLGALLCQSGASILLWTNPVNAATTGFPTLPQSVTKQAIVQGRSITDYEFSDGEWTVRVIKVGGELRYEGSNINQSKGIRITGGKKSKKNGRFVYTWQNRNISYIVIWNPNDPSFARLQVTESGRLILNKLLNTTEKAQ
jgi:hypothetical protein